MDPVELLRAAAQKVRETKPHLTDYPLWLDHVADTWTDDPVLQEGEEQSAALDLARLITGQDPA